MDANFLESVKENLVAQKEKITNSLEAQNTDMKNLVKIVDSGDEADVASDAVDRTLLDSLSAQDAQRLRLIDNALDRIRQGKYGLCAKCGKEIPQARLEALPYALMCVGCASAEERRRR